MLRMRRCHNLRLLCCILFASSTLYFLLHKTLPFPASSLPPTKHTIHPIYEQTSLYRKNADQSFETELDAQLLALEQSVRSLFPSREPLLANLTIHQITTPKLASQHSGWVKQWRSNNPGWEYNQLTTHPAALLAIYSDIPSILSAYETTSLRQDLVRYLLLWYHGGFYSDINTWERVSLTDCAPIVKAMNRGDISLMVGIDRDEPFYSREAIQNTGWSRAFGFGTSTIWAVQRFDPLMRTAIIRSISHARAKAHLHNAVFHADWDLSQSAWEEQERSEISGAGMFTDIVLDTLTRGLKDGHELRDRDAGIARRVSWKKFKRLKDPLWIDQSQAKEEVDVAGIAILPIDVWSNGQDHSGSGTFEAEGACVNRVTKQRPREAGYRKSFW